MADIFVSYTSSDREWAFWIGQELGKLKHKPRDALAGLAVGLKHVGREPPHRRGAGAACEDRRARRPISAKAIHMQLLTMPPGARAKAHKHASHVMTPVLDPD